MPKTSIAQSEPIKSITTREQYAAYVFITETLESSIKTFIGNAATIDEATQLARVAMAHNALAEGYIIEPTGVNNERAH